MLNFAVITFLLFICRPDWNLYRCVCLFWVGMEEKESCRISDLLNRICSVYTWVELPCSLKKIKFLAFLSVFFRQTSLCLEQEIFFSWKQNLCFQPSVIGKQNSVRWMIVYFSSYFLECDETEVSQHDKEPTYDCLIESKKRRIVYIFSFVSSIH